MGSNRSKSSNGSLEPAGIAAALVILGLTFVWFILERNFESLIAMVAGFSGLFSYVSIKSRRVNWLLAGLVVVAALGAFISCARPQRNLPLLKF